MLTLRRRPDVPLAHPSASGEDWQRPDWQQLWLATQGRSWRSLAVIPGGEGAPPDFSLKIATMLARTGMLHLGTSIQVADARTISLSRLVHFNEAVDECVRSGEMVIIALAPTSANAITIPMAQSADAALLCLVLGVMTSGQAKKAIETVGAKKFLGAATFPRGSSRVP